jgi:PAS domain S-box-containing protein
MWSQGRARNPASASGTPARPLRTPLLSLVTKRHGARAVLPYVTALSGIAVVTLLLLPFRNQLHTAVAPLIYLVLVVFVALAWGMNPAIMASLAGALALDHFILPPTNAFSLSSEGWAALLVLLITAVAAGKSSVRARHVAAEAEAAQVERLQKQAGELREQAQLLDVAHDAIMVRDLDGRIRFWNQGAAERYGWSTQEAIGKITHELLQTAFPKPLEEINAQLQRESFWEGELEHSRRDGKRIVVASRWVLQRRNSDQSQAVLEINNDITERKRAEESLREAHEELEQRVGKLREQTQLLDLAHDAIMVRDLDGRISFWNQGAAERYGWSTQEAIGRMTHELLQTAFPKPLEEINAQLQRENFWEGELEHSRRDGERIVVASRWVLQRRNSDQSQAVLEINNDITERKRAEESLRKAHAELEQRVEERTRDLKTSNELLEMEIAERMRAQSILAQQAAELARSNSELEQFAYIASHDLQEPLRMVGSYVQLLERNYKDLFDAKGEEYIAYAVDGAKRMQMLINDLLAYSRVGTQGNDFALTDCAGVVGLAIKNLQKAIQESGATITCEPLPTVRADRMQLLQLFQNLLANAIKFRAEHPPELHITAQHTDGFWQFAVKDNGIGIEPRHFERIFLIFQRLNSRRQYPGTGMGLAISKKIVDRHGGTIWPVSEPGMGTTFFFTLPDQLGDQHESQ